MARCIIPLSTRSTQTNMYKRMAPTTFTFMELPAWPLMAVGCLGLARSKKKDVASISDTCSGRSASGNKAHRDSNNIRAALKVWWRVRDFQVCHEVGKCPGVAMHVQYAAQCIAKLPGTPVLISASEHFPISKPIPKIEPAYLPDACPKHGASNSNPPQETPHMQVTDPTTDVELQAEGGDMIKVSSVRLIKNH
jgi:hypothetical protein